MYFAFGDVDVYPIVDLPDHASAAALSLAVNQSGAISSKTVVLLTPEELDGRRGRPCGSVRRGSDRWGGASMSMLGWGVQRSLRL